MPGFLVKHTLRGKYRVERETVGMSIAESAFLDGLKNAFNAGEGSDFTIACGTREWKVHKFVLSTHSPVLKKACYGHFVESTTNTLNLTEDGEDAVDTLLDYLYNLKCKDDHTLLLLAKMIVLGDKYEIPHLTKDATRQFETKVGSVQPIDDLAAAAKYAYQFDQPTGLIRVSIADLAATKLSEYACNQLIEVDDKLAVDIAKAFNQDRYARKRLSCRCRPGWCNCPGYLDSPRSPGPHPSYSYSPSYYS